jgi:hypothetical protein
VRIPISHQGTLEKFRPDARFFSMLLRKTAKQIVALGAKLT